MNAGHVVKRGTRLVSGLKPGLATRSIFTTAQDVTLWPLKVASVSYVQDRSALSAAGIGRRGGAEAALRIGLRAQRQGPARRAAARSPRPAFRQPRHGAGDLRRRVRRPASACPAAPTPRASPRRSPQPEMVGIADGEALMPQDPRELRGLSAAARIFRHARALPFRPRRRPRAAGAPRRDVARAGVPVPPPGAGARRPRARRLRAVRHADRQPVRARLQRDRARSAQDPPGRLCRPHPAARLRDLPRHPRRGRRRHRAGRRHPGAVRHAPRRH